MNNTNDTPPSQLWHYTTLDSAISIILNHTFWATDIRCVNDTEEIIRGVKNTIDFTKNKDIKQMLKDTISGNQIQYYLTSFCSEEDILTQWMCYGPAGGCAICFDTESLLEAIRNGQKMKQNKDYFYRPITNTFLKCEYFSDEDFKSKVETEVSKLDQNSLQHHLGLGSNSTIDLLNAFASYLSLPFYMKNICFKHESEYRLLWCSSPDMPDVKFTGKPHIEINLEETSFYSSIKEIMVSPHGNREAIEFKLNILAEWLCRSKKRSQNDGFIPITFSKLPYRG